MVMNYTVQPTQKCLLQGSHREILVQNGTQEIINVSIPGQVKWTPFVRQPEPCLKV